MNRLPILLVVFTVLAVCPLSQCEAQGLCLPVTSNPLTASNPIPGGTMFCFGLPTYEIPGYYQEGIGSIDLPGSLPDFNNAFGWYSYPSFGYTLINGSFWNGQTYIFTYTYLWQGQWWGWVYIWGSGPLGLDGWHELIVGALPK